MNSYLKWMRPFLNIMPCIINTLWSIGFISTKTAFCVFCDLLVAKSFSNQIFIDKLFWYSLRFLDKCHIYAASTKLLYITKQAGHAASKFKRVYTATIPAKLKFNIELWIRLILFSITILRKIVTVFSSFYLMLPTAV